MKTLIHHELVDREFGTAAAETSKLRAWVAQLGAVMPAIVPELEGFDIVHLESWLCAMERPARDLTDRGALTRAASIPCDDKMRAALDDGDADMARWLVGADVHDQWRQRLRTAIDGRHVEVIDALSGLPLSTGGAAVPSVQPVQRQGLNPADLPAFKNGELATACLSNETLPAGAESAERVSEMRAMRAKGETDTAIGKHFRISRQRVAELIGSKKSAQRKSKSTWHGMK